MHEAKTHTKEEDTVSGNQDSKDELVDEEAPSIDSLGFWRALVLLKIKFGLSSTVATAVDYTLYLVLEHFFFTPVVSNLISQSCGMVVNFLMQKRFVFVLQRKVWLAFFLSMGVSVGGIIIGTAIIYLLNLWPFFEAHQYITKICATGVVFFYNFYFKRYVFEKKFI